MGTLEKHLRARRDSGRKLLMPYVSGGITDDWLDVIRAYDDAGADAVEVGIPVRREHGSGHDNAEASGQPGKGSDLGHRKRPALLAACTKLESGERGIGLDQTALSVDPSAHGNGEGMALPAHDASGLARREPTRPTAAR